MQLADLARRAVDLAGGALARIIREGSSWPAFGGGAAERTARLRRDGRIVARSDAATAGEPGGSALIVKEALAT